MKRETKSRKTPSLYVWGKIQRFIAGTKRALTQSKINMNTKVIEGHPNYSVAKDGTITSRVWGKEREIKPVLHSNGYQYVSLTKGKQELIHRIVAKTFLTNNKDRKFVNHIDGDKLNNTVDNIEWCSRSENMQHAYGNFLVKRGRRIDQFTEDGRLVANFRNASVVGINGFSSSSVLKCCNGKQKLHKGFVFKYAEE